MALVATAVTVAGLAAAWMAYRRWLGEPREVGDRAPGAGKAPAPVPATARARGVAYNAFYVDELYHLVFVRPFREIADFLWHVVDDRVIDGAVNGVGRLTESAGEVTRRLQTGYVRTYLLLTLLGAALLAIYLIWMVR
jgi:NADH-quinone oxidoreductase subunit L